MRLDSARLEFKLPDLWIGLFWKTTHHGILQAIDVWICVIPCFPLHLTFVRLP